MYNLSLKMEGPLLKEGIPLHMALDTLENFQAIVDKAYLVAAGKQKVTQRDRNTFHLKATEFRRGSLEVIFDIFIKEAPLALPLIASFTAIELWDFMKLAFDFLKLVFSATRNDKNPTYNINIKGDVTVIIDGKQTHFPRPAFEIAERVLPNYQNLLHQMEAGGVKKTTIGRNGKKGIFLTTENHDLFDIPRKIEDEERELECDIFRFNKYAYTGNIEVNRDDQIIPQGTYSFVISGTIPRKKYIADYITGMLQDSVILKCKIEWRINPLYPEKDEVEKVHVYGVEQRPATSV